MSAAAILTWSVGVAQVFLAFAMAAAAIRIFPRAERAG